MKTLLPPYELDKHEFKRALHGYNAAEVEEYLAFVIEKYKELYLAYNEIEKRESEIQNELDSYKRSEAAIQGALINAQNSSARILKDANDRSALILRSAQENCDKILLDYRSKIKEERAELAMLRTQVAQFKVKIFNEYQRHIEYLESISPEVTDEDQWMLSEKDLVTKAVSQIMFDVSEAEKIKDAQQKVENGVKLQQMDESMLEDLVMNRKKFDGEQILNGEGAQSEPVLQLPTEKSAGGDKREDASEKGKNTVADAVDPLTAQLSDEEQKLVREILGGADPNASSDS